jgi:imidazoleglycerol phosphate synthase glutamine amidotransferase subunit HisH
MNSTCPKCGETEIKMDTSKNEAVCTKCYAVIEVSSFFKKMMLDKKETIKTAEKVIVPENGHFTTCQNEKCEGKFSAEVNKKSKKVFCPHCKAEQKLRQDIIDRLIENKIFEGMSEKIAKKQEADSIANGQIEI